MPGTTARSHSPSRPDPLLSHAAFLAAVTAAREGAPLPRSELHGEEHWRAVAAQGLLIARICGLGAEGRAVEALFGLFHDCRRETDGWDPAHGARGVDALAASPVLTCLDPDLRDRLLAAIVLHDQGEISPDPLIGLGWDADRSTLGRVGIAPAFGFFSCVPAERFEEVITAGRQATASPPGWSRIWAEAFGHPA